MMVVDDVDGRAAGVLASPQSAACSLCGPLQGCVLPGRQRADVKVPLCFLFLPRPGLCSYILRSTRTFSLLARSVGLLLPHVLTCS